MLGTEEDPYIFENNTEKEIEKFVGVQNYATSAYNGIGGKFKTLFKDFIVKEIIANKRVLDINENSSGHAFSEKFNDRFTTFNLTKVNMDTFEAIKKLSDALEIPLHLINYSGLKDKHSISVQRISIKGNYVEKLKNLKLHDIFIRNVIPSRKPVKLGSHLGNNFTVIIRNIENSINLKTNSQKILNFLQKNGFPNYFGLQRFGNIRPNSHIIGYYLLKSEYENAFNEFVLRTYSTETQESRLVRSNLKKGRNFEEALQKFPLGLNYERKMIGYLIDHPNDYRGALYSLSDDLRRLLVSSFQSYIFNKMISLRISRGLPLFTPVSGDMVSILDDINGNISNVCYTYGGLYDKYLDEAFELNRASIVIPIIGKLTNLDDFPLMNTIFNDIARKEHISESIFKSDFEGDDDFKGSIRAMTVRPWDLELVELTDDELHQNRKKIKIEFSLQKGSYATMLIREFIK